MAQWLRRSTIYFFFGLLQPKEQFSPYVRQMQRLLSFFFAFVMCEGIIRTCFEVPKKTPLFMGELASWHDPRH
jgi:hypothetical protein